MIQNDTETLKGLSVKNSYIYRRRTGRTLTNSPAILYIVLVVSIKMLLLDSTLASCG